MELSNSAMGRTFPQKLSCGQPAQRPIQSWRRVLVRRSAAESALTNLWKCPVGREYAGEPSWNFNNTAPADIYPLALHDALPISSVAREIAPAAGQLASCAD